MNREQCNALIERLADREDIHLCEPDCLDMECKSCLCVEAPVYIGIVLERMRNIDNSNVTKLLFVWQHLNFSKSLQTILDETEWEKTLAMIDPQPPVTPGTNDWNSTAFTRIEQLKDPNARALFDYLITLFL